MYNYTISQKSYQLTQDELTERLTHLTHTTKTSHWVGRDLKVYPSSFIGRFLWIIAKHFACMRHYFYSIDLEESKSILQQLKPQLQQENAKNLFTQAVSNFNSIAPRHQVQLFEELEEQVDLQPQPELAKPKPIQQEQIQVVQEPEKKPAFSTKIEITKNGYEVNAKIFDATSNKEIGLIEGELSPTKRFGMCFHISNIKLKDANEIGKGYGSSALRQYLTYLQTSDDPQLKQVTYYHLLTHQLRPEPVRCFTKVGFEKVDPKDYGLWKDIVPYHANTAIMMVKKRDADKATE